MDLISRVGAWALRMPRVLVVDAPGNDELRWGTEAELDRRGWPPAVAPADTDLLVVLGEPGPELAAAIELVWSQVPAPRARVRLRPGERIGEALDAGRAGLQARVRPGADDSRPSPESLLGMQEHGDEGMEQMDQMEHMDHGGGDEGMEQMDHMDHMHHGGEVAGLPMAQTGPDRDGLELDALKVSLGPVLPGWPTGLVLRAELHGDVLTAPELSWLDAESLPAPARLDPRRAALDQLARFLLVAGWPTAARDARRARDGLDPADPADPVDPAAEVLAGRLARRVLRSRALAWTAAGGSVGDLVRHWCEVAAGRAAADGATPSLAAVAGLVDGAEIGTARLVVAAHAIRPLTAHPSAEPARA